MNRKLQQITRLVGRIRGGGGQSLVETALIMPLLCLVLVGAAEFARVAYTAIEVSNAAKAAAQYGAQSRSTASDTTGMQTAAANDAVNVSGLSTSATTACICSDGSASTCGNTDCPTSRIEEVITVTTSTTYSPLMSYPGLPTTFVLHGQAVQTVLQ